MNRLKQKLRKGRVSVGAWIQIGHPAVAEILAGAGFDWVCVDLEHGAIDLPQAAALFASIELHGSVPMARVPENDTVWIRRVLDSGAKGVIVPMVNTAEQAEMAVRAAKYPPRGVRGFGYCRANKYGADFAAHLKKADREIIVILQIEHINAIGNLEEILTVKGVDGLFIGPMDLSGSMGVAGKLDHPEVRKALARFLFLCKKTGVPAGLHIIHPECNTVKESLKRGYRFMALGLDTGFLRDGAAKALSQVL